MNVRIEADYKEWLIGLACAWCGEQGSYVKLFEHLYSVPFIALLPMDENRIEDGKEVRLRFSETSLDYTYRDVYAYMYSQPCSVLELMVGLALRVEEQIMFDPEFGDRSGAWFYDMLRSLKLNTFDDYSYNAESVDYILKVFINREYEPNGEGSLFTLLRISEDMRNIEIWGQACRHFNEILDI